MSGGSGSASGGGPPAIGAFVPPRVGTVQAPPPDPALVAALWAVTGLSAAVSDELDAIGFVGTVPAGALPPLRGTDVVVGRAITLRYLPARGFEAGNGRLAHLTLFGTAASGDVAVIEAPPGVDGSVLGGRAAAAAVRAGIAGIVVDGAIRDTDEILATGLPAWARSRTPATGRGRIDAVEINGPVRLGTIQVVPGDVVVADSSGIAVVPAALFAEIARRILGG